jgi:phage terminase small subunit
MSKNATPKRGVLKDRQLKFVEEYLVDLNATQAAIRAGYAAQSAGQYGHDLLRKPHVQAAIEAEQKKLTQESGVTHRKLIEEAARLAFSDIRKVFTKDGALVAIHELDDATAAAISSVKVVTTGRGEEVEYVREIRLWDKNSAIEKLIKHLGLNPEPAAAETVQAITVTLDFETVRAKLAKHAAGASGA